MLTTVAKRRRAFTATIVAALLALSPTWFFELLYQLELLSLPTAVTTIPRRPHSTLVTQTLWLAEGEHLHSNVRPLWAGNFFDDPGRDPHGFRAASHLAQLRMARLGPTRTLQWQLRTAALTVWFTRHESVAELQQSLAEETYFGRRCFGFDQAARLFFAVPAEQLSIPQVALLAGLPESPARFDPIRHPNLALRRRAFVLRLMFETGLISLEELTSAMNEPPRLNHLGTAGSEVGDPSR